MVVNSLKGLKEAPAADMFIIYLGGVVWTATENRDLATRALLMEDASVRLVNFVQPPTPCGHPVIEDEADYRRCPDCGKEWPV